MEAAFSTMSNNNALTNFTSSVSPAAIQLPLRGEAFGRIPCPCTVCKPCAFTAFRREQAPALRLAGYLCARRDAPPGASGKGRLWHGVAGKGKRDDTRVHSLPQSRPLADPAPSEREPWVRAFIFSTILSLQAYAKSLPLWGG